MQAAALRQLPGIRFEPRAAALSEALPRMDVAVLIGFAASGPLDTPVAIEGPAQFQAVFGDDCPLAWDAERGLMTTSLLGATVRAFFSNGGRRCWIVRVAGDTARADYFALPGVVCCNGEAAPLTPAFARARAKGSWADVLRVSTALQQLPLRLAVPWSGDDSIFIERDAAIPIVGDVLRLRAGELTTFARVRAVDDALASPAVRVLSRVTLELGPSFTPLLASSPVSSMPVRAWIYTRHASTNPVPATLCGAAPHPFETAVDGELEIIGNAGEVLVTLPVTSANAPPPGAFVQIELDGSRCFVIVDTLGLADASGSAHAVRVRGRAWMRVERPSIPTASSPAVDRVTLDLHVTQGSASSQTLRGLGFAPEHPRYWNDLCIDESFFQTSTVPARVDPQSDAFPLETGQQGSTPTFERFPLAGADAADVWFVPLAVPTLFGQGVAALTQPATRLERDGLSHFAADLFLDPDLADASVDEFMARADTLRYLAAEPRPLRGIHAALGYCGSSIVEEATLAAVPDAVHRNWQLQPIALPPQANSSALVPHPQWWHFLPCDPQPQIPNTVGPDRAHFIDCDVQEIPAPQLELEIAPDASGTFTLLWSAPALATAFVLEEANAGDFSDARTVYTGADTRMTLYGRSVGDYYYRVRAFAGRNSSHWSAPVSFRIGQPIDARVEPEAAYSDDTLLDVHLALMRMCAGRGDLFATLSLPGHYREREAMAHASALCRLAESGLQPRRVPPLRGDEARALSYASLYHPWVATRTPDGRVGTFPPDGVAVGVLASRAALRGAWIAPANEPLREVVGLAAYVGRDQWQALQQAQINLVRREARGFLCLSADTLSLDPALRPINVRRLLILLRRLALRRGTAYVFEPLSDAFHRLVQRGFEAVLFDLFQRGAFAGRTTDSSYQVVTGEPPNTTYDLDNGRFVVELKVAPSLPMSFLSIRLLQAGERLAAIEVH